MKIGFYPCCATDIDEPCRLLAGMVDEIVFCDISHGLKAEWSRIADMLPPGTPKASLMSADALLAVQTIPRVDVLFYRRDSTGEGGSHLFVLGDEFLRHLALKFPPEGGLIITDGSNSRGGNFKRMTRPNGMDKHALHFAPSADQRFETLGLKMIMVSAKVPGAT